MRNTFWVVLGWGLMWEPVGKVHAQPIEPGGTPSNNVAALAARQNWKPGEADEQELAENVQRFFNRLNVPLEPDTYPLSFEAQNSLIGPQMRSGLFGAQEWFRYWAGIRGEGIRLETLSFDTGDRSQVTLSVSYKFGKEGHFQVGQEKFQWRRTGAARDWGLLPEVPKENELLAKAPLRWAAYMLGQPKGALQRFRNALTQDNLRQLGLGMREALEHLDNGYAFEPELVQEALRPYLPAERRESLWLIPGTKQSYSFNARLSGKGDVDVHDFLSTIVFYEGEDEKPVFRYGGKTAVCFFNGQVRLVNAKEFETLRWEP